MTRRNSRRRCLSQLVLWPRTSCVIRSIFLVSSLMTTIWPSGLSHHRTSSKNNCPMAESSSLTQANQVRQTCPCTSYLNGLAGYRESSLFFLSVPITVQVGAIYLMSCDLRDCLPLSILQWIERITAHLEVLSVAVPPPQEPPGYQAAELFIAADCEPLKVVGFDDLESEGLGVKRSMEIKVVPDNTGESYLLSPI